MTVRQHWAEDGIDLSEYDPEIGDIVLTWFWKLYYRWMPYEQMVREIRET